MKFRRAQKELTKVSFTEAEYFLNTVIFAVFFSLISTEFMAGSSLILRYHETVDEIKKFIVPIWEVTGTFFVFYVVNVEGLAPAIIPDVASIYIIAILAVIIVYSFRNASIIFAEFVWKGKRFNERTLYTTYAGITLFLGLILLIVYGSIVDGRGVDLANSTFSFYRFLAYLPDIGFMAGTAIIYFGHSFIFYRGTGKNETIIDVGKKQLQSSTGIIPVLLTIAGIAINVASFAFVFSSRLSSIILLPVGITVAIPVLGMFRKTGNIVRNKVVYLALMSIAVAGIERAILPYLFDFKLNVTTYFANQAMQNAMFIFTIIGGITVLAFLSYYFKIYFSGSRGPAEVS